MHLQAQMQRAGFALDVSLVLPGRGVTALFGPSGSGKTTCLRILAGLERGAHANVLVGGQIWQDSSKNCFVPPHQRALGYVFQEASLFDHLTVEGNLRFGYDRTPRAQRHHAWDHGLALLGIGHLLHRRPQDLSGGERQRVAIARALASSPRLLLMDEPLAALDAQRKAEILPWLERLHNELDIPVVYVTHALDEVVQLADHLVVLEEGRALASGPALTLLSRSDLPMAHSEGASALIEGEVAPSPQPHGLALVTFPGGRLLLPQPATTPWRPGQRVRIRVQARDVSIALQHAEHTSVLNILPAVVSNTVSDGPGQVQVGLQLGGPDKGSHLIARISALSAERLALRPGQAVFAQIKGIAMVR
ncbi:MAG: molybdenum ABC transporter ATP-binding protein [Burkholderiaceae bacterium]